MFLICPGGSTTGDEEEGVEGAAGGAGALVGAGAGGVCGETKRNTQHNESIQECILFTSKVI